MPIMMLPFFFENCKQILYKLKHFQVYKKNPKQQLSILTTKTDNWIIRHRDRRAFMMTPKIFSYTVLVIQLYCGNIKSDWRHS